VIYGETHDRADMAMVSFHRGNATPERTKTEKAGAAGGRFIVKKRQRFGKVAESFQSRWSASFGVNQKSDTSGGPPKSSRYVATYNTCGSPALIVLSSSFLDALLRLPNELHLNILRELCVADVLSLRATARVLNELITGNTPALVRHWVRFRLGDLHLRLYPTPKSTTADFPFLLAMRRRHIASIRLTRRLADILVGDPSNQPCSRKRLLWTSVYERMMPLVFGVGFFLDEHRRLILERDLGQIRSRSHIGYHVCTTNGITDQERDIMKRLDRPLRLQY
jgi:hypothetical protein